MRRVRRTSALAVFLAATVVGWALSDLVLRHRGAVPVLTPWGAVAALVISGAVLVCGLAVRRLRSRERTWMTPTGAVTTAAAAQASALVGAAVGGVYAGQLLLALLAPSSPAMSHLARMAAACLLACLLWSVVGFVVEHWCVISDDDDDVQGSGPPPPSGAAA